LDVVECVGFEQFAEAEDGGLVFSAGNRNPAKVLQFLAAARVIGDDRLFKPADTEKLDQGSMRLA
jgi:hypothetical protein